MPGRDPNPALPHNPWLGARVAPQRCPILRAGYLHYTGSWLARRPNP